MAGVQNLGGGVDDLVYRDLADNNFNLDLGNQGCVDLSTTVFLAAALLQAAAHNLGNGHAGHADSVHGSFQSFKLGQLHDHNDLVHAGIQLSGQGFFLDDLDGGGNLGLAGHGDVVFTQVSVLVHAHLSVSRVRDGEAGVSGSQAVLVDIQAVDFFFFGHTQADGLFDDGKDDGHGNQHPGSHADNAQNLNAKETEAMAVQQALTGGEQAGCNGAPHAVHAVHGNSADRVINLDNVIKEFNGEDAEHTGNDADDGSAERINHIAACGNGNQTGQSTVKGKGDIRFAVTHPAGDQRGNGSQRSGQVGIEADQTSGNHGVIACHCHGGATVEPEPAEPQDKHAQGHGGQVVAGDCAGLAVLVVLTNTGAKHPGAQAGGNAANKVNGGGTGKIMEAQLCQPAAAPDPVAGDGVNDQADSGRVAAVSAELGTLCHGAGNNGCCRCTEHGLEHGINPKGHALRQDGAVVAAHKGGKAADERAGTCKHDAEADQPEARCADAEVHHVFHQDVAGVLCTGQASFAQSKACLHKVHQECRNQHPDDG